MKSLVAFASLAFLASATTAFSAPPRPESQITCSSTGVADAGFNLVVSPNQRNAELSATTFAGPRPLAHLRCIPLFQAPGHPDQPRNFLLCSGISRSLGNVAVRLYTPGFSGRMTARVLRVSRIGFRRIERLAQFGNLLCQTRH